MRKPRTVPTRDERYMGLAFLHASFSKDPNTQVGAVIVNSNNEITGTGYNGPPKLINDDAIDWSRPNKYPFIKHAEANAIDHSLMPTVGSTLYVTGKPCGNCMLKIVDAEILKVVYFDMKRVVDIHSMLANEKEFAITDEIAKLSGIQLVAFDGDLTWMRDRITHLEILGIFC